MATMERCCDVGHLEGSLWMGWKGVMKLGNLKYCVLSTFLAMVEIFHALRSLWAALFPFVLLWWNVMVYATCSKYYSWNCAGLRLPIAESNFHGDVVQDRCSHPKEEDVEESENSLLSSHQRESFADASDIDRTEIGIPSLCQEGTHDQVVCYEQENGGWCSTAHEESNLQLLRHDLDVSTYCRNQLHMINPSGGMASALPDVPHISVLSIEAMSPASDSQALVASSQERISKLSSLCFLDGVSLLSDRSQWVASAFPSQHRVPPLAMLDVSRFGQFPMDVDSVMQGMLSDLSNLLLGDGVSADMPLLRARILGRREKDHKVPIWRHLWLSTISHAPSVNNAMVSWREVGIIEEPCVEDFDCAENHAVDEEGLCSAIIGSSDGLDNSYEDHSVQFYETDGCCSYDCDDGVDSCVDNFEHVHDVEESSIHSGSSADNLVYEHCLQWDVGYHDYPCVKDAEGITDSDSELGNTEDMVVSNDGIHRVAEDGLHESSVGAREIYATELDTWWDEGAVLVDNQAREDDSVGEEPEWEMV